MFQNLLVFISSVAVCFIALNEAVEFVKDPSMQEGKSSYFECVVDTGVTAGVTFFIRPAVIKGGCLGPGIGCSSTISGYHVSQNSTATYLTIDSVNCTRETGDWYCQHDVTESTTSVLVNCGTIPSADGSLVHNGLELDVIGSNEEQQQLKVVISCANPSPPITWKYKSKDRPSFETIQNSAVSSESTPTYSGSTCDSGKNFTISTMTASADDKAFCGEKEVYFSVTYYSLTVESSTPVSFKGLKDPIGFLITALLLMVVGLIVIVIFVKGEKLRAKTSWVLIIIGCILTLVGLAFIIAIPITACDITQLVPIFAIIFSVGDVITGIVSIVLFVRWKSQK